MTLRPVAGAFLLIGVALVACADPGQRIVTGNSTRASDLIGVEWVLDAASIAGMVDEVPADTRVTLELEDGEAHGTAACNSYGGSYDADDDGSVSFEGIAVTEMACDPELMALESTYLQALTAVTHFEIEGLMSLSGEGFTMTFDEEAPPVAPPLIATPWRLTSFAAGEVVFSVLAGTEITATLDDDTIAGSAGCNRYSGTFMTAGTELSFSPLATTKMRCDGEVMEQESAFIYAMGKVASFSIDGSRLLLFDGNGAMLLSFDGPAS